MANKRIRVGLGDASEWSPPKNLFIFKVSWCWKWCVYGHLSPLLWRWEGFPVCSAASQCLRALRRDLDITSSLSPSDRRWVFKRLKLTCMCKLKESRGLDGDSEVQGSVHVMLLCTLPVVHCSCCAQFMLCTVLVLNIERWEKVSEQGESHSRAIFKLFWSRINIMGIKVITSVQS